MIIRNQEWLAQFNELVCPVCWWIVEDKNKRKMLCMHCWRNFKIWELEIVSLVDRIPKSQYVPAHDVLTLLWNDAFLQIILWCNEDGVVFKQCEYRFTWDYKLWKRLRWIKNYPSSSDMKKFDYELWIIRVWIPISRQEIYPVIKSLYRWLNKSRQQNHTLTRNSTLYKSKNRDKEIDYFMTNIIALVSTFVRWYENLYDKVMWDDVVDEDFEKFQEMLWCGIGDFEIEQLKNWDPISLSSLVPAIEYVLSKSILPSVSLIKQSYKWFHIINDLPSTHPFYDLLHEKPHED